MNKKLITLIALGALTACSQAETPNAQAAQPAQAQSVPSQVQESAEMQVTYVNATEALEAMRARPDLVVIDVRTPAEFAEGHIEGALNIDYRNANFSTEIAKLDGSQDYIIHCRSGHRSKASLEKFKEQGFSHIIHMDGGILGWNKANLPTVK
jgi:phage shock protein E